MSLTEVVGRKEIMYLWWQLEMSSSIENVCRDNEVFEMNVEDSGMRLSYNTAGKLGIIIVDRLNFLDSVHNFIVEPWYCFCNHELRKLFQLAYDVHMYRMIPRLVIILEGEMCTSAGSESHPPMLNKENYVPSSSRLLRYAKSRPNGKLIHNSILNGPYVRRIIPKPGDANREVNTILLGFPEDIYVAVDSCETAHEIWLRVQQMMKGSDIGIQEKKAKEVGHYARNCMVRPRRRDAAYLETQLLIAQKEEAGIQLQAEEYDLMAVAADLDKIEEVNANCILMASLQQASTSGTQTDSAPVYDTDGSAEVHENCDDNEIFNMFTQEEQYTELLEPIPESHQVPQNDNDVISEDTSVEQGGEPIEQHSANFEETRALYESLYQNLAIEVEKVNSVNCKLKETNADMTTELARYKNQERCFEISQEKYDKLEWCYQ
nr:hypothetical protein [Tanacetum cinerariifolium]